MHNTEDSKKRQSVLTHGIRGGREREAECGGTERPSAFAAPIAIVMAGKEISAHFGRAERVMLIEVEGCDIKDREILPAPPHAYGALPSLLKERGVGSLVTGNIGASALRQLESAGITVYTGARGSAEDVLGSLLSGSLKTTGAICRGGERTCAGAHEPGRCE